MLGVVLIIGIILLDQLTKYAVTSNMDPGQSIEIIRGFFAITYISNDGAAFSSFRGQRALLIAASAIAVICALIFLWKNQKEKRRNRIFTVALSLIAGGGIGNLIDRILSGSVTDMLDFSIFPPIFNVADIGVTVGCFLLIIYILIFENRDQGKEEKAAPGGSNGEI